MRSIFAGSLLLLVALSVARADVEVGDKPVPCSSPQQWEAKYFSYDEVKHGHAMGKMTYDAINQRERFTETVEMGCKEDKFDILYLHNQGVEYVLNLKTKKCIKRPINKPWIDFGIPKDSTFITSTVLGSLAVQDANLKVDLWRNEFKDPFGNKVRYMGTWSTVGCLPIESIYTSNKYKFHTYFSDITVGAPEDRFKPDPACLSQEDSTEANDDSDETK